MFDSLFLMPALSCSQEDDCSSRVLKTAGFVVMRSVSLLMGSPLWDAMNVPSLFAELAMIMREEKAARFVLGAKLVSNDSRVRILQR